ncbi:class I SAM-dependent methyltransferase [Methanolobus sp. ZRKC5]|uniref:class I SAM-dependent methyltransferase n=1 Tax=unclassified Methanolobus TaxID=2629569 RepID=UPI00313D01ED
MRTYFDQHANEYDAWYDKNMAVFDSELSAIVKILANMQPNLRGIEIGVGTGRFASKLHLGYGLDPSTGMLQLARQRNIKCVEAVAEKLPFKDETFDMILMVTVICFLDDVQQAFNEAARILRNSGVVVIGMIDRNSHLGKAYDEKEKSRTSHKTMNFRTVDETLTFLHEAGLSEYGVCQTLFKPLEEITIAEPAIWSHGEGGFVVISAGKNLKKNDE